MERSYGSYRRSFGISDVDGVLRLTLSKPDQRLPEGRRLEIE